MKIIIETIKHSEQKYRTAGDYWREPDGTLRIVVSETGNNLFNSLVGLHELVEVLLMERRGIPLITSNEFDIVFERERDAKLWVSTDEPGDDPRCPYRKEHRMASIVEELVAHDLGVDLDEYATAVNAMPYEPLHRER